METFSALLAICAGNSPVPGEFPTQRPVTRSFDIYFDLRPNKWLSKQSRGWWFETLSCSLWRHSNGNVHPSVNARVPYLSMHVHVCACMYIFVRVYVRVGICFKSGSKKWITLARRLTIGTSRLIYKNVGIPLDKELYVIKRIIHICVNMYYAVIKLWSLTYERPSLPGMLSPWLILSGGPLCKNGDTNRNMPGHLQAWGP